MDSEIIRAVQKENLSSKNKQPSRGSVNKISDDLYKDVITPLQAEFREPIVSPHWWKKPADNFKGFAAKTRINNTIWRQWYVHFVEGKETAIKFANPMPLADKYHARVLAVVVEGHYWCRKHGAIRAQYSTWRKTRKNSLSRINVKNLLVNNINKQDPVSPGVDDIVLSGMLNGFNDLEALDLCVHFDFPENLGVDMMGQCDSFLDDILQPSDCTTDLQTNGCNSTYALRKGSSAEVAVPSADNLDTTSLNTLATAADMSQYYQSSYQPPLNTHYPSTSYPEGNSQAPYPEGTSFPEGNPQAPYPEGTSFPEGNPQAPYPEGNPQAPYSQGSFSEHGYHIQLTSDRPQFGGKVKSLDSTYNGGEVYSVVNSSQYSNLSALSAIPALIAPEYTHANTNTPDAATFLTGNMAVPKGPAYYPPTRLQYSYSTKDEFPTLPPDPPPVFKQKLSEIEVDRKRRRAMNERLQHLKEVLPPAAISVAKQTHANILNNAAEFLRKEESNLSSVEADIVKVTSQIEETKRQLLVHQSQIPENGISSACYGCKLVEQQYRAFLEEQGGKNPLMKLYSTMLEPLFLSFNSMVDNASLDTFCKTVHQWFAQNCSLVKLRELATNLVTSPNLEFESAGEPSGQVFN